MNAEPDIESHGDEDIFAGYVPAKALRVNFNYLFFPGLILHELAHYLACIVLGSKVYGVTFWSPKGGVVVHHRVRPSSAVLISLAPFFLNNLLAFYFITAAIDGYGVWALISWWLAFSLAIYSLPSMHDLRMSMNSLDRSLHLRRKQGVLGLLAALVWYPVAFVLYYLFLTPLLVFARNRTLRIAWFFIFFWIVESGVFSAAV
ncbi:hypothetical protein AUJ14_04220 [Candidatus Micrarchaeota archaeon CG1_02_55_22]|nr:MAG: hypothetical protein AUJ14_04220 [Candidatus Micrarchaeota archaeon CG1_02_55_22]